MALEAAELACGRQGSLYFVENISYTTTDMLYSLQLGLGALLAKTDPPNALFVLPGDMAGVSQTTFRTLAKRAQHSPARVLRPTCNGITGHPILIRSECLKPVLGYSGEGGLRQALAGHPVESVETGDIGVLLDADEPADLEVLRKHMAALRHGNSQNVATADTGRLPGPQVPTV
jgi:CTP:molybdopterin cytidylyltransferase MocA